jgi:RHH-type rel operon transcriptional repressor/antitoxin RelB
VVRGRKILCQVAVRSCDAQGVGGTVSEDDDVIGEPDVETEGADGVGLNFFALLDLLYDFVYHCNTKAFWRCSMNTAISIRLPKALADQIDSIAKETERPRSYIIQKALESYIEDYADLQVALDRLHDKTDPVVSGKELRKALGL